VTRIHGNRKNDQCPAGSIAGQIGCRTVPQRRDALLTKQRGLAAVLLAPLLCLASLAQAEEPSAVALIYHRFGEDSIPSTNVRLEQFEAHIAELRSGNYSVLPLPEILTALRNGDPLPPRTVAITIDDAFLSVYQEAWPRLKAADLPFTLFVATDPIDQGHRGFMTWDQLREMQASGNVSIGNHGDDHGHMAGQTVGKNRQSLARATRRFEEELGFAPQIFAYPFGEFGNALKESVKEQGFLAAFGQQSGAIGPQSDMFALPRYPINETYGDMDRFTLAVNSLPLPVRDISPQDFLLAAPDSNPPAFGFTLAEGLGDPESLNCYAGKYEINLKRQQNRRIEVRFAAPLPQGRARLNCTMPGPVGRWRWFGAQFYVE